MITHCLVKMNALGQIGLSSYFLQIIKTSFENIFQTSLYHKFNQMQGKKSSLKLLFVSPVGFLIGFENEVIIALFSPLIKAFCLP